MHNNHCRLKTNHHNLNKQKNNNTNTINQMGYWSHKQVAEYLGYNNVKTFYNDLPKHYQQGLKILHMPVGNSIRKVFKAQDVIDYADKLLVDLTA